MDVVTCACIPENRWESDSSMEERVWGGGGFDSGETDGKERDQAKDRDRVKRKAEE